MNIAVITGASAGIGRELVYAVDKDAEYDEIWVIARRKERLEELRGKCRNPIRPIALDLSDLSSIDAYQALLEQEQPEIKMLVNAAGCGVFGPFAEADRKKLISSAQLNSLALTGMCHASLPYMHSGSNIINMGSNSAWQPVPFQAVYGASKSYVLSLSRALGRELRPQGIHVMCVCPGWIKTEFQQVAHHDEFIRYVDKWYGPDEVAAQAMKDADAFYQRLSSRMERRYLVDASQTEKERKRLEARNQEIDGMFLSLYTDKAKGVLTEQRFMKLTAALEQEQEANQKRLHDLAVMQSRADAQESEVRTFIKEIRRYAAIEELDESVLNRLISKILIGEVKKVDGQKVQEVRIVYNFVGEIPEIAA